MTFPRDWVRRKEAKKWLEKAQKEYDSGSYDKALEYSENALAQDPGYLEVWKMKISIYLELERHEEGIQATDVVLAADSADETSWVWVIKALFCFALGFKTGKIEHFILAKQCSEKADELRPDIKEDIEWIELKTLTFQFLGDYETALKMIESKREADIPKESVLDVHLSKADIFFNLGRYDEAITNYKIASDLQPDDADPLINIGLSLCHQEKFDEAITFFDKALKKDVNNVYAYNMKGYASYEMKMYTEANQCFAKALDLEQENSYSWFSLGQYNLAISKQFQLALSCFKKVLALRPNDTDTLTNVGISLFYLSKYQDAISFFDEALKSNSTDWNVLNSKGVALYGLGNYHDALKYFDKSLEAYSKNADAWNNRGNIFYNTGRFGEAMSCYDQVLKINPSYIEAWYNKGITNLILKNYEEAIICFTYVIDSNHVDKNWALLGRGESHYERGRLIEALEDFNDIKDPNLSGVRHHNLGLCYYQLGMYEDADKEYHLAINEASEVPLVYYNMAVLYAKQEKMKTAIKILESDRRSQHSIDAYKKLRTNQTREDTDWYNWWFGKGGYKMALGLAVMVGIFSLITTIALVSLGGPNSSLFGMFGLNVTATTEGEDANHEANQDVAVSIALVIVTVLLTAILLLPSLTKVKVGNVELETAPITTERGVELEPLISSPSSKTVRTLLKAVKPKLKPTFKLRW